jgi:hypothetical protein
MAATRTPGITIDARGDLIIDKEYRGTRLFRRLGRVSQEQAEAVLRGEMLRLEAELDLRMHARPLFPHARRDTLQSRRISGPPTRSHGM